MVIHLIPIILSHKITQYNCRLIGLPLLPRRVDRFQNRF